jgi:hypothetical protein
MDVTAFKWEMSEFHMSMITPFQITDVMRSDDFLNMEAAVLK